MKRLFISLFTVFTITACIHLPELPTEEEELTAEVLVDKYLAIDNGIYYWFKPSSKTTRYYWNIYEASAVPQSDVDIIYDCNNGGVEMINDNETNRGYTYNRKENTAYTICIIAYDSQGKQGKLTKKNITTDILPHNPFSFANPIPSVILG